VSVSEIVTDNVARSRFEQGTDGESGFIDYRRSGSTLFLNHVEVPAPLGGRGVGTSLVRGALDLIRSRGERIVPVCPFVKAFLRRYPAYADLSAP
jgi:predicted GNAT family acetyltransferase